MSFATDYNTAYKLLREGTVHRKDLGIVLDRKAPYDDIVRQARKAIAARGVGAMGRVRAAVYAVKLVKEMRRQKVLFNHLLFIIEDTETRKVGNKNITLFPITVNRTVVQMRDPKKND